MTINRRKFFGFAALAPVAATLPAPSGGVVRPGKYLFGSRVPEEFVFSGPIKTIPLQRIEIKADTSHLSEMLARHEKRLAAIRFPKPIRRKRENEMQKIEIGSRWQFRGGLPGNKSIWTVTHQEAGMVRMVEQNTREAVDIFASTFFDQFEPAPTEPKIELGSRWIAAGGLPGDKPVWAITDINSGMIRMTRQHPFDAIDISVTSLRGTFQPAPTEPNASPFTPGQPIRTGELLPRVGKYLATVHGSQGSLIVAEDEKGGFWSAAPKYVEAYTPPPAGPTKAEIVARKMVEYNSFRKEGDTPALRAYDTLRFYSDALTETPGGFLREVLDVLWAMQTVKDVRAHEQR